MLLFWISWLTCSNVLDKKVDKSFNLLEEFSSAQWKFLWAAEFKTLGAVGVK